MNSSAILPLLFINLASLAAFSAEVEVSAVKSDTSSSQTLGGSMDGEIQNTDWSWEAFLDHTQGQWTGTDSVTGAKTTGNTKTSNLGGSFATGRWTLSPNLALTDDQSNKMTGTEISLGTAWKYAFESAAPEQEPEADDQSAFAPWVKPSLKIGRKTYRQTSSKRRSSGDFTFVQNWLQYGMTAKPFRWVAFSLREKKYTYSRDPSEVLAQLEAQSSGSSQDSSASTQGMSDTLSSLLKKSTALSSTVYPSTQWETTLSRTWAQNEADASTSVDTNLAVYWLPNDQWTIGLQGGQSTSGGSTEVTKYSGASVGYAF